MWVVEPDEGREPSRPQVLGVVEDERLRATVVLEEDQAHLRIEGTLDHETAPVVKELLDALDRWHRHRARATSRRGGAPPARRLVIDATSAGPCDPAGWRLLAEQRDRWRRSRGPCVVEAGQADGLR